MDSNKHIRAQLRLLQTTDVHGHLLPYDYFSDAPQDCVGLARTATLIAEARAQARNSMLFEVGDFLQGALLTDMVKDGVVTGALPENAIIAAMNALDYDAVALGNHEFNYGLDYLKSALLGARFPVVCANLFETGSGLPLAPPSIVIERELLSETGDPVPIRVGVIGLSPPQIVDWDAVVLNGALTSRDIVSAARDQIPAMRAAGADIVLALCHSGLGGDGGAHDDENVALQVARLDGIDAVMFGHSHEPFPAPYTPSRADVDTRTGMLCGKPALNAGTNGCHLGVMDLTLTHDGTRWRISEHRCDLRPICRRHANGTVVPLVTSDPTIVAAAKTAHERTLAHIRRPIGETRVPLHSYFSRVQPDRITRLVADAKRAAVKDALDRSDWADLPRLATVAPFKSGGRAGPDNYVDIASGPLAIRHASDLYLFPNTICVLDITGKELRDWLERSASAYHRIAPHVTGQVLWNADVPSYNFDTIDGLSYAFDLSQPARFDAAGYLSDPRASRVRDLRHAGRPVGEDDRFALITNSYRIGGGGQFRAATAHAPVLRGTTTMRDAIEAYFKQAGPLEVQPRTSWQFAPVPGATALFETGNGAAHYLADLDAAPLLGVTVNDSGGITCEIDLSRPAR